MKWAGRHEFSKTDRHKINQEEIRDQPSIRRNLGLDPYSTDPSHHCLDNFPCFYQLLTIYRRIVTRDAAKT